MAINRDSTYPGRFETPTTTNKQGGYKNRTSPTSNDGSYLEKTWKDDEDALRQSLLVASGVTINNVQDVAGANQAYRALIEQIIGRAEMVIEGAGSAVNAYIIEAAASNEPPDVIFDGMTISFRVAASSTAAATINAFGFGVKSIVNNDGSALGAGQIPNDRIITVRYDLTADEYVLGGDDTFTQRLPGLGIDGFTDILVTSLNDVFNNRDAVINSNTGSPLPFGESGSFKCRMGSSATTAYQEVVGIGDGHSSKGQIFRRFITAGAWDAVWTQTSDQFPRSLAVNGYQQIPGGMIMQWGTDPTNVVHGSYYNITFPMAFTTACLNISLTQYGTDTLAEDAVLQIDDTSITVTGFDALVDGVTTASRSPGCSWFAIGF